MDELTVRAGASWGRVSSHAWKAACGSRDLSLMSHSGGHVVILVGDMAIAWDMRGTVMNGDQPVEGP